MKTFENISGKSREYISRAGCPYGSIGSWQTIINFLPSSDLTLLGHLPQRGRLWRGQAAALQCGMVALSKGGGRGCVPPPTGWETRPLRGATQNACHSEPAERVEESTHEGRQSENDNAKILRRGFALLRMTGEWGRLWRGKAFGLQKL